MTSVYWAMSTMTTVGYGDVPPIQTMEKLIAMAGMLVGVTVFAYVTGTVSLLLSTFNAQVCAGQTCMSMACLPADRCKWCLQGRW